MQINGRICWVSGKNVWLNWATNCSRGTSMLNLSLVPSLESENDFVPTAVYLPSAVGKICRRDSQKNNSLSKKYILRLLSQHVIPESAVGGCPESRKNNRLLDTGSRPPQADSSGMTINRFRRAGLCAGQK